MTTLAAYSYRIRTDVFPALWTDDTMHIFSGPHAMPACPLKDTKHACL